MVFLAFVLSTLLGQLAAVASRKMHKLLRLFKGKLTAFIASNATASFFRIVQKPK